MHAGFYRNVEHDEEFLVVEEWATRDDSNEHLQSDLFTVLRGAGSLMTRPPEIVIHTVSGSTELEV